MWSGARITSNGKNIRTKKSIKLREGGKKKNKRESKAKRIWLGFGGGESGVKKS